MTFPAENAPLPGTFFSILRMAATLSASTRAADVFAGASPRGAGTRRDGAESEADRLIGVPLTCRRTPDEGEAGSCRGEACVGRFGTVPRNGKCMGRFDTETDREEAPRAGALARGRSIAIRGLPNASCEGAGNDGICIRGTLWERMTGARGDLAVGGNAP